MEMAFQKSKDKEMDRLISGFNWHHKAGEG